MIAQRQRLTVRGIVQGVGFRPFVYRLASELSLSGWVQNQGHGVTIEAQGSADALERLAVRLQSDAPRLARVEQIESESIPCSDVAETGFSILASKRQGTGVSIGPDGCVCDACLQEIFEPGNRRYRYALINCTDCGARYTLVRGLPYDRPNTSMAAFAQCDSCLGEYTDPGHRRFHAEPNACPDCGPQLRLLDACGQVQTGDPLTGTLARLRRGEIIAIKGLGGFHLACDARNAEAVARLRSRKKRAAKPLAVMVANTASLARWVSVSPEEQALLSGAQRPIVLLEKHAAADCDLPGLAPGVRWLGAMLPYTPVHYLLFHEAAGRPRGLSWLQEAQDLALVMTSANVHGEPLVTQNQEALQQLAAIADAFLLHDRDIVTRCDDSVMRVLPGGAQQFVRRSRGYTPLALPVAGGGATVLALGGHDKNTFCLVRDHQAFLSQHIGDLDRVSSCLALEQGCSHLQTLLQIRPQVLAHDLHADFFSSRLAQQLSERWQLPLVAVQHHHAHIAAVLAEHRVEQPVLGLALDGVGLGLDGQAWGGELLLVDGAGFERLGHLRGIGLPGGDRAAREPWRMGAAALSLLGRGDEIASRFSAQPAAGQLAQLLARGVPLTSSMGRWFDAAAGLLGIMSRMQFEGQSAMYLEALAEQYGPLDPAPAFSRYYVLEQRDGLQLDLVPLLQALSQQLDPAYGAALFHAVLIEALAEWVAQAAVISGIARVACAGGCFLNRQLVRGLQQALRLRGLDMLLSHEVPPGDGGLSLGQAWVARKHQI
jgi:hydrogenase maturation protein HypF